MEVWYDGERWAGPATETDDAAALVKRLTEAYSGGFAVEIERVTIVPDSGAPVVLMLFGDRDVSGTDSPERALSDHGLRPVDPDR